MIAKTWNLKKNKKNKNKKNKKNNKKKSRARRTRRARTRRNNFFLGSYARGSNGCSKIRG